MAAALLLSTGSPKAQPKIDEAGVTKKLEKLESDSKDPKKNTKGALWADLGKTYLEAAYVYIPDLFKEQAESMVVALYGKPTEETTEEVGGAVYKKLVYPNVDLYFNKSGNLHIWNIKKKIVDDALVKAGEAFVKSYSLDQSTANTAKVKTGLQNVGDAFKLDAENNFNSQNFTQAAEEFAKASWYQGQKPLEVTDSAAIFNAGFIYDMAEDFTKAEPYLNKALEIGYYNNGDVYYYLFHSYYGQKNLDKARSILLEGVGKFPSNVNIIESLMGLYAETGSDPNEIIPYVMAAIEKEPKNPNLYAGLGRIYDKMGNMPKAIEAFQKADELLPNDFSLNFNLGLMYIKAADAQTEAFNNKTRTSTAEYNADLAKLNEAYEQSLVPLEKAHTLDPKDPSAIELLKNIYFRLRDTKPEYSEQYDKYDALFKSM